MSNEKENNEKNTDLQRIKENNFKGRYAVRADATGGYVVRGDTRYGLRTSQVWYIYIYIYICLCFIYIRFDERVFNKQKYIYEHSQ